MDKNQILLQVCGIGLAVITAIGCIAYEKLVKALSCGAVVTTVGIHYLLFAAGALLLNNELRFDMAKLRAPGNLKWWYCLFLCSGATSVLWYHITRAKGVIAGSLFEVKYIVILALFYCFMGENKWTIYTVLGVLFALASIYFITK